MDERKRSTIEALRTEIEKPGARYKLIANATVNAEHWTVLLIASPFETQQNHTHDRHEIPQDNLESNSERMSLETVPSEVGIQHHSVAVSHSADKDALLGLCHHLLLDAVFRLWSYANSLQSESSLTDAHSTVKG